MAVRSDPLTAFVLQIPICSQLPGSMTKSWAINKLMVTSHHHGNLTPAGYAAGRAFRATEVSLLPLPVIALHEE